MIPILYQTITEGTVPTNYGIGALTDCLSCEVLEERNGKYELNLVYPASGIHAEEIEPNRFIKAKPNYTDNAQLFRIYKVGKPMNGRFSCYAQHVSYDLSGKLISSGTASSCAAAITLLQPKAGSFTLATDISKSASFKIDAPSSVRSWFGGKAGSLLDLYGGEWKYDNYTASLMSARGADRGVQIRYGKNLTQLSQELDMSNLVTGIVPYYIDSNGNVTEGAKVSTGLTLDVARDIAIDFSQDVNPESGTAILTQLANLATAYKNSNNLVSINNAITLDFVQNGNLTERVDLCDTVHIFFEALGITASAKCISTTWDVLKDRYTKTTFGSARTNIADTISKNTLAVDNAADRAFVNHSSALITGNLGGYVVLHDGDGDGEPDEILIMNTADISTATQVWRWNKGGLGYATSYAGPYNTIAITADGKINASAMTTGTLNANLIKAGTISDVAGNSSINMSNGVATLYNLNAKNMLSLLDNSNVVRGFLDFTDVGGTALTLKSNNGNVTAVVQARANKGGGLWVYDNNGNDGGIFAEATDGQGGYFGLYNNNGNAQTIYGYGSSGSIVCVSLTQTSSREVKDNIKPIEDAEKILEIDAVSFDYKDKAQGTNRRGFIAEDVAQVLPNLVTPKDEEGHPASLDYMQMIPYLQAVIKEQEKRIAALESKINKTGG